MQHRKKHFRIKSMQFIANGVLVSFDFDMKEQPLFSKEEKKDKIEFIRKSIENHETLKKETDINEENIFNSNNDTLNLNHLLTITNEYSFFDDNFYNHSDESYDFNAINEFLI